MPSELPVLVIATRNAHKTQEIREMIGDRYKVLDVNDFPALPAVDETGTTFLENATLKAVAISGEVTGLVLSDDSGLEVDALGGAPGVWSSSYGGEEGNHPKNNARLMVEMAGKSDRAARFRCTMVLAKGGQVLADFSGTVEGRILEQPYGAGGFGYDPLFAPEGHDRSFAELGAEVKNALSHRGRALAQLVEWLEKTS
ncbi:RdgB/HAM1 family non-canonical purine NTP pyrophosphatase [Luteolibacter luteus]|uniref:dITP/XTP pyrophosphatase n=1 Tax=Luteolibacter luteus TaxID=2728835 RepID=A0A858RIS2_9BACT|nr:RdgB/HAM1 family non-canonical purine NTP pyrophosphatase [Luteolibacter luteus]QJE96434.1 RdgB/HAM1 family non-canonical purine NTP pyrophosphatase [Luteolibacter luteus]